MPLNLEGKQAIVAEVNEAVNSALSAVVADYRGLSVEDLTELRQIAREQEVYLRVVRNTLLKRAVKGTEFECIEDSFVGPSIIALSTTDPGAAARVIKDFAKDHELLKVRALAVGGKAYGAEDIDVLAKLPTLDQARSMLMSVMLAPATKLVQTLNEVPGKLVRTLAAVKDQKDAA